jgi:phosphate:Na+ symporter
MGMGIGTCITAVLSSLGTGKNARRAAFIHLAFNVIGTFAWLTVFSVLTIFIRPAFMDESATYLSIAVINTVFKSLCTVLLLPMSNLLERLSYVFIKDSEDDEKPVELDERLLVTPSIALEQCHLLAVKMGTEAVEGFKLALAQLDGYNPDAATKIRKLEKKTDHYEDVIGSYLTKLARSQVSDKDGVEIPSLLKAIGDFERISDHSVNLLESVEELQEKKMDFSESAKKEMGVMCTAISEILENTLACFISGDAEEANNIEPLEQVIDDLKRQLRNTHIARLTGGECTVEAGFVWADLLTNLERTSDHCSNIALTVIDAHHRDMNAHIAVRKLKHTGTAFAEKYQAYAEKYHLS